MSDSRALVDKLWAYCNVLRYKTAPPPGEAAKKKAARKPGRFNLLFLKMAHEREHRALKPEQIVPPDCSWQRCSIPMVTSSN